LKSGQKGRSPLDTGGKEVPNNRMKKKKKRTCNWGPRGQPVNDAEWCAKWGLCQKKNRQRGGGGDKELRPGGKWGAVYRRKTKRKKGKQKKGETAVTATKRGKWSSNAASMTGGGGGKTKGKQIKESNELTRTYQLTGSSLTMRKHRLVNPLKKKRSRGKAGVSSTTGCCFQEQAQTEKGWVQGKDKLGRGLRTLTTSNSVLSPSIHTTRSPRRKGGGLCLVG